LIPLNDFESCAQLFIDRYSYPLSRGDLGEKQRTIWVKSGVAALGMIAWGSP